MSETLDTRDKNGKQLNIGDEVIIRGKISAIEGYGVNVQVGLYRCPCFAPDLIERVETVVTPA